MLIVVVKLRRSFANELAGLAKLKRFMFDGRITSLSDLKHDVYEGVGLVELAKSVALKCHSLEEVGDSSAPPYKGYVTAKISRDQNEVRVNVGMGHGMVMGQEDQAFPKSQPGSY
jgi:hypothetical protein